MRRVSLIAAMVCTVCVSSAMAEPVTASRLKQASDDPGAYVIDGQYLTDEKKIAAMRANGDLPDTIRAGKCNFEIAGDPGVVYYVRACP